MPSKPIQGSGKAGDFATTSTANAELIVVEKPPVSRSIADFVHMSTSAPLSSLGDVEIRLKKAHATDEKIAALLQAYHLIPQKTATQTLATPHLRPSPTGDLIFRQFSGPIANRTFWEELNGDTDAPACTQVLPGTDGAEICTELMNTVDKYAEKSWWTQLVGEHGVHVLQGAGVGLIFFVVHVASRAYDDWKNRKKNDGGPQDPPAPSGTAGITTINMVAASGVWQASNQASRESLALAELATVSSGMMITASRMADPALEELAATSPPSNTLYLVLGGVAFVGVVLLAPEIIPILLSFGTAEGLGIATAAGGTLAAAL